ncbi:MAG: hypothetical protein IT305_13285 [Chloroflexi bacterium]|nr:hypothetical protein [Chloroflexota bacterium]
MGRSLSALLADATVVQDDARQHVFWMQRLLDPTLFQGDLYADYFSSLAPPLYVGLYWLLGQFLDPIAISRLLPPVLGLAAAVFTFLLTLRLYPSPIAASLATILGGWYVWQYDDLPTASPRSCLLPLLAVLAWALVSGRRWLAVMLVAAAALLYPSAAALGVALTATRLLVLDRWPLRLSTERRDWLLVVVATVLTFMMLAPAALGSTAWGPQVDAATARTMPEFGPNGRNAVFNLDLYQYWIVSYRTGFDLRVGDPLLGNVPIFYELGALAFAFPLSLALRRWLPAARSIRREAVILGQIVLASLGLFFLAHLVLFRLYLPARYVAWTIPLVLAICAGIGLTVLFEGLAHWSRHVRRAVPAGWLAVGLALGVAAYPARYDGNYVRDQIPRITAYLREQPPTILVAGVPTETDSVPAFAERRVLVNREYSLAYHPRYYAEVEQRNLDLIEAYYSDSPRQVAEFAARYGIDVFLVNRAAFDRDTALDAWAGDFAPYVSLVRDRLRKSSKFALLDAARRCGVLTEHDVTVVPASCVAPSR